MPKDKLAIFFYKPFSHDIDEGIHYLNSVPEVWYCLPGKEGNGENDGCVIVVGNALD